MAGEAFQEKWEEVLRIIEGLPTLPDIVFDLERALESEGSSAIDVALVLEEDPSLTANVLKAVNSVYFGGGGTVYSVREAVARLGFREIRRLTTSLQIINLFQGHGRSIQHKQFWKHSLVVGYAAKVIAEKGGANTPFFEDEAFVAGLVHDVGVLILDQYFQEDFGPVLALTERLGCELAEAELSILGLDHGEVGGRLLDQWNLPEAIREAVRWHHRIEQCPPEFRQHASTIFVADCIAKAIDPYTSEHGPPQAVPEEVLASIGLEPEDVPIIIGELREEAERSSLLLTLF